MELKVLNWLTKKSHRYIELVDVEQRWFIIRVGQVQSGE